MEIDLQCAESTEVDEITREVRFAIEQSLIDTERDRLEALLESIERAE